MLALLAVAALNVTGTAVHADDWQPPNRVRNGGFEAVGPDGAPEDWGGDPAVYSVVASPAHSGSHALQYVNSDPGRYVLCAQQVPLETGKAYEVTAWVKTEGIEGEDTGATLCLEWRGPDGKWLGGHYPSGLKGAHDWQRLHSISGRIPKEATGCSVVCYVRQGMTGKAWWDDVEVRQWREPPLHTVLLSPNYRGEIGPSTRVIDVLAQMVLDDYGLKPGQVSLRVELTRPADGQTVYSHLWRPKSAEQHLRFAPPKLSPGPYTLGVTLVRRSDQRVIGSEAWRLRVMEPEQLARRVSYVDEHNRLIREGKPFFPLGMYWGGIDEKSLRLYADSPFNCLMPYGGATREQMDLAESLGLKVIYTVKDTYHGSGYCPAEIGGPDDERPYIEARTKEFRDHPALLAWYLNDELPVEFMDRLEAHQEWLEELDPSHPTWVVLYQVDQLRQYAHTFDVIGTDPYPIPEESTRRAGTWTRMTVESVANRRPVWMVPQVFNWACYRTSEAQKAGLRPPTLAEMRSMSWQCIAEGAQGLIYYSWSDIQRDAAVPFEEQWGYVKQVAGEVKEMIPVIVSAERAPRLSAEPADWLHWTTRRVGRTVYLIAVNDARRVHRATFGLAARPRSVRLRGSAERPSVSGTQLEARLEPLGVSIYEMRF